MFIGLFMAPGFLSSEPGRMFTRQGAEKLYDIMMQNGAINLNRQQIEELTQGFGPELFRHIDGAANN